MKRNEYSLKLYDHDILDEGNEGKILYLEGDEDGKTKYSSQEGEYYLIEKIRGRKKINLTLDHHTNDHDYGKSKLPPINSLVKINIGTE